MGDRLGSSSRGHMSEDKVHRKDWCWSVRAVYVLGKLSDVSVPGLEEVGRYRMVSEPTLAVLRVRVSGDVPGLGLTDEDVGLLRG